MKPQVTVVTATYNRSDVLRWAIESVRRQTYPHWEQWVIGDACTDDTERVVASFADPRVRFHDLPRNVGEQSGPNNEGCRRARGDLIAFLNHDDLWFPDHLVRCVDHLQRTGADLVCSLVSRLKPGGSRMLVGTYGSHHREGAPPHSPASAWVFKRALFEQIGGWRFYKETHEYPSVDWLDRVWRAGKRVEIAPHLTVLAVPSTIRPKSYVTRDDSDQRRYFELIHGDPGFRERELLELLYHQPTYLRRSVPFVASISAPKLLRGAVRKLGQRIEPLLGLRGLIGGPSLRRRLKPRGYYLDQLRKERGLS